MFEFYLNWRTYDGLLSELKSIERGCLFFALGKPCLGWVDRSNAKRISIFIVTSPRILGGCIFEHATCTYKNGGPAKFRGEFNGSRLDNFDYDKCRVRSTGVKSRATSDDLDIFFTASSLLLAKEGGGGGFGEYRFVKETSLESSLNGVCQSRLPFEKNKYRWSFQHNSKVVPKCL